MLVSFASIYKYLAAIVKYDYELFYNTAGLMHEHYEVPRKS